MRIMSQENGRFFKLVVEVISSPFVTFSKLLILEEMKCNCIIRIIFTKFIFSIFTIDFQQPFRMPFPFYQNKCMYNCFTLELNSPIVWLDVCSTERSKLVGHDSLFYWKIKVSSILLFDVLKCERQSICVYFLILEWNAMRLKIFLLLETIIMSYSWIKSDLKYLFYCKFKSSLTKIFFATRSLKSYLKCFFYWNVLVWLKTFFLL